MSKRDWRADWYECQDRIEAVYAFRRLHNEPYDTYVPTAELKAFFEFAKEALPYWLDRARELEAENADLLTIAKIARKVADYFETHKDFVTFAAAISELDVALLKADAWITGRQIGREG